MVSCYEVAGHKLYQGDCLKVMAELPDGCVDMVLTDPPYGTTACKWDAVIPFDPMWAQLKRLIKPNGAIVLTASQPFTSALVMSNIKMFKYCCVWEKTAATGFLNAKKAPLRAHEDILIFYKKQPYYNPIMVEGALRKKALRRNAKLGAIYNKHEKKTEYNSDKRYPRSVILLSKDKQKSALHPTQKPVALMSYLIRTYTHPGETVLDFTTGSGTTGVACVDTDRKFIGIECGESYYNIASGRILEALINANI